MMTTDEQMDGLAATIALVPNIGIVRKFRTQGRDENTARRLYYDTAQEWICAWEIAPAPSSTIMTERFPGFIGGGQKGGGQAVTTFRWVIEGVYGIETPDAAASEERFYRLAYALVLHLNQYGRLPIPGLMHQEATQLEQFGYKMLQSTYLLHWARISIGLQGKTIG